MTFKALNWSPNEILSEPRLDDVVSNMNYLLTHTPRAIYTLPGLARVEGVKMATGRALIPASASDTATVSVTFGGYFSNNCQPNITTGIVNDFNSQVFCVINGIGTLVPDHQGFKIVVNVASPAKSSDRILRNMYVTWNAMGY